MKTIFKSKIALIVLFMGVLFSCKNNQDGYSDEVETTNPTDSTVTTSGSAHGENIGTESADSAKDTASTGSGNASSGNASSGAMGSGTTGSGATEGTGSGPGESAKDGSTYTSSSGTQKDSASAKKASQKNKK